MSSLSDSSLAAHLELEAWNILHTYMTSEMSLGQAEEQLRNVYAGTPSSYNHSQWNPTLMAIMEAEDMEDKSYAALLANINSEIENISFQVFVLQVPSLGFSPPSPPPLLPDFVDPQDLFLDRNQSRMASDIYSPPMCCTPTLPQRHLR
ncbi:hypothetical protein BDP27DRAFT_1367023 [Rhodocollybia butyracea]|uniref:Uncharacterized protein n=1 Tax=Rhodocollybia butyracea TaxID=206335 RepID=A0A9P5PK42_9AGAR|nr:hypothetical protein BDP27DRAFT_1367023 [Rhodocollybia butyracea]